MVGQVTSEGDRALRSDAARDLFKVNGSGIKIGIISDSFRAQPGTRDDIEAGDLPGADNPNGFTQPVQILKDLPRFFGIDEGRAMAHIIHDVAPGAELLFHTVVDTTDFIVDDESFSTAVRALADAGADVIVDDIGFSTTIFQDGLAAQTIDAVAERGVVYLSAAGNDGFNRSYESPFRLGETFSFRGIEYEAHDFDVTNGTDIFQEIRIPTFDSFDIQFSWQEAAGQVESDFDLFLLDQPKLPGQGGNILASSIISSPSVTDAPVTDLFFSSVEGDGTTEDVADGIVESSVYLLIAKKEGSAENPGLIKWTNVSNGAQGDTIYEYVNDVPGQVGAGNIYGNPNAAGAIAVGAASFRKTPEFGVTPVAPEPFSSAGATPILFDVDGTPLATPEIREKPDIFGPDRVATNVEFFERFPGTSAAAPHIAGVVALMLERAGGSGSLKPEDVRDILRDTDIPVSPRPNQPENSGFVQADAAVLQSVGSKFDGTAADDELMGLDGPDNLYGFAGNDILRGGRGLDALFGGDGDDQLIGGGQSDFLSGEQGVDILRGGRGGDTLMGGGQGDRLLGGQGADLLMGDLGRDTLIGGRGDDILIGGRGSDTLRGDKGKDVFVLEASGMAIIQDFQEGRDQLAFTETVEFNELDIIQRGSNTTISLSGNKVATLMNLEASTITADDVLNDVPVAPTLLA
ncbi:MAG: S8 family serine peptidase [Merismopedia sp. SIO2A8]|nr:S8 family serine peptidase [Merismopedia sp. SIO2A8]